MTADIDTTAQTIADAFDTARQIAPLWPQGEAPSLDAAYEIARRVRRLQGRRRVGRKVGFTNRAIWPIYGVDRPIWGEVRADGVFPAGAPVDLSVFTEPRIEPEIVLGLGRAPSRDMRADQLAACIDWVAPGFEIVQSIFPGWKFTVEESIAAQGLHGCLVLGDRIVATKGVLNGLAGVPLELVRGATRVETGKGANALGGPLAVLAHLVPLLPEADRLEAGELVTTGTLTDAWPVAPGEQWSARYGGVIDAEISVRFT